MIIHNEVSRDNQSRNGVRVFVSRDKDDNTIVDASCQCFGMPFRVHNNDHCPNRKRMMKEETQ